MLVPEMKLGHGVAGADHRAIGKTHRVRRDDATDPDDATWIAAELLDPHGAPEKRIDAAEEAREPVARLRRALAGGRRRRAQQDAIDEMIDRAHLTSPPRVSPPCGADAPLDQWRCGEHPRIGERVAADEN